ncbi:hypothetical protein ACFSJY_18695 [Thalassotalea euphylliae]|uniref:hypothetical protein n=1 Tax=Thalassotalea euphylliae TaxID=1655234 RepID=UPI003638F5CD
MSSEKFNKYEIKMAIPEMEFRKTYTFRIRVLSLILFLNYYLIWFGLYNFVGENEAIWYQRSGSLIVFLSVLAEYFHLKIQNMVNNTLIDYGDGKYMTRMQNFKSKNLPSSYSDPTFNIIFSPQIVICGLLGTVIWGYGDLFYNYL